MARAMGSASPPHPHLTVIDLGQPETIGGVRYTPRPGNGGGRIQNSRFTFASAERPLRIAREALRRNPALQSKTSEGDGVEFLALTHRDQLIVHLVNSRSDPVNSRLRPGWDSRAPVRALQTTAFADLQTAPAACVRSVAGREGREHLALLPPYSLTTLVQRAR
jgi:hypothetical protein